MESKSTSPKQVLSIGPGVALDVEEFISMLSKIKQDPKYQQKELLKGKFRPLWGGLLLDIDELVNYIDTNFEKCKRDLIAHEKGQQSPQAEATMKLLRERINEYKGKDVKSSEKHPLFSPISNEKSKGLGSFLTSLAEGLRREADASFTFNSLGFQAVEVDHTPVETPSIICAAFDQKSLDQKSMDILKDVKFIRRFTADPSPIYMTLGCILLDNMIEFENATIDMEIKNALTLLQSHNDVMPDRRAIYKQVGAQYNSLIIFIKKEISSTITLNAPTEKLKQKIYEILLSKKLHMTTLSAVTRAVFVAYILKNPLNVYGQDFNDAVWTEFITLPDKHISNLCQLFAKIFSFKVNLIESSLALFGNQSLNRKEIYPTPGKAEFAFETTIVNIQGKNKAFKAIGYSENEFSVPLTKQTSADGLLECSVCSVPVSRQDVLVNKLCGHVYCIYCIEDTNMTVCGVTGCSQPLNADSMGLSGLVAPKKKTVKIFEEQKTNECSICCLDLNKSKNYDKLLKC